MEEEALKQSYLNGIEEENKQQPPIEVSNEYLLKLAEFFNERLTFLEEKGKSQLEEIEQYKYIHLDYYLEVNEQLYEEVQNLVNPPEESILDVSILNATMPIINTTVIDTKPKKIDTNPVANGITRTSRRTSSMKIDSEQMKINVPNKRSSVPKNMLNSSMVVESKIKDELNKTKVTSATSSTAASAVSRKENRTGTLGAAANNISDKKTINNTGASVVSQKAPATTVKSTTNKALNSVTPTKTSATARTNNKDTKKAEIPKNARATDSKSKHKEDLNTKKDKKHQEALPKTEEKEEEDSKQQEVEKLQEEIKEVILPNAAIIQREEYMRVFNSQFTSKETTVAYIVGASKVLPLPLRFQLFTLNRETFHNSNANFCLLLQQKIEQVDSKIKHIENIIKDYTTPGSIFEECISKEFQPSLLSKNGLKLISKDEEENLCSKDPKEEIVPLFQFILILLNKPFEDIQPQEIVRYFIKEIVVNEFKQETIKNFFINNIMNFVNSFTLEQFETMEKFMASKQVFIDSKDLIKINRAVSYMSFYLKDIYDFLCQKGPDQTLVLYARHAKTELVKVQEYKNKLLSYLSDLEAKILKDDKANEDIEILSKEEHSKIESIENP